MNRIRIELILMLLVFSGIVNGQILYRSHYPDSILYSEKINNSILENNFSKEISFHFEIWRQKTILASRHLLVESNDSLFIALKPSIFIEKILPNYKYSKKEDKVVELEFALSVIVYTPYFDSINKRFDRCNNGWGERKYNLNKIIVEKIDTAFLFDKMKMNFNYSCKLELDCDPQFFTEPELLTTYYFIDKGNPIYKYRFFPGDYNDNLNYLKLEFYNMEDNLRFLNMLKID